MFRVNLFTGELCLTLADLWLPGLITVNLQRVYQSQSKVHGGFGAGWSHPYEMVLEREGAAMVLRQGSDELHRFVQDTADPQAYELSRSGDLWRVDARAQRRLYFFEASAPAMRLHSIVDRNENRLRCRYHADGGLAALVDPVGRRLEFDGRDGLIHQVTLTTDDRPSERHVVLRCAYDDKGRLTRTINGAGGEQRYGWTDGLMTSHMNALGGWYSARYDGAGRCIRAWEDESSFVHAFTYDKLRNVTLSIDSVGQTTLHRFDEAGNLVETVDPLGGLWAKVRDANGAVLASLDAAGRPVKLTQYDPTTRLFSSINAEGARTTIEKDAQGNVVAVVDAVGKKWAYRHDTRGNAVELKTPADHVWHFSFSDRGELVAAINPAGARQTWRWSDDRRELVVADELGITEARTFDLFGRTVRFVDGRGASFQVAYEALVQRVVNGDGSEQRWDFDALGNMVAYTNEAGQMWCYEWDRYGRPKRSVDPVGGTTEVGCDAEGRINAITNECGRRLQQTRDALGRVVHELDFAGSERRWRYGQGMEPVHTLLENGDQIDVERDPMGQPVMRRFAGGIVFEDAYDGLGRLISARGPTGTVELEFEPEGRPLLERTEGAEVRWQYGPGEHPTGLSAPDRDVRFEWDVRGRLQAFGEGTLRAACSFDDKARLDTVRFDSGVSIEREYDVRKRLVRQRVEMRGASAIVDEQWVYDSVGNPLARTRLGAAELAFEHNRNGELASVRRGGVELHRFAYDPAGNIAELDGHECSCDVGNRLLRSSTLSWQYDAMGRPTTQRAAGETTQYAYDVLGRLACVSQPEAQISFDYDSFFRRTEKRSPAGPDRMLWAGNTPLTEQLAGGGVIHYLFHPVDEVPLALSINGVWHYAVTGFRGELTDLVRATDGALVWSAEPLGFHSDVTLDLLGVAMPLRERGQLADAETGLIYQRARYYAPQARRFLTPDPLGVFAGWNVYRYCFNRPFVLLDPLGLACTATEQECDAMHADIQKRATHLQERWNESHTPNTILPWGPTLPVGAVYTVAETAADGTTIPAGSISKGSVDSHLRAYDDEQRGLGRKVQDYYQKGCAQFEDAARGQSMAEAAGWTSKPMSLPAYGLP